MSKGRPAASFAHEAGASPMTDTAAMTLYYLLFALLAYIIRLSEPPS
ncbi:MAG: hypothetical protein LBK25_01535 [Treponema sp.]|jgi:hypothetical protein|nr:hypothetical protein [Treponema sp.]